MQKTASPKLKILTKVKWRWKLKQKKRFLEPVHWSTQPLKWVPKRCGFGHLSKPAGVLPGGWFGFTTFAMNLDYVFFLGGGWLWWHEFVFVVNIDLYIIIYLADRKRENHKIDLTVIIDCRRIYQKKWEKYWLMMLPYELPCCNGKKAQHPPRPLPSGARAKLYRNLAWKENQGIRTVSWRLPYIFIVYH